MELLVIIGIGAGIWILWWISDRSGKARKYEILKPRLDTIDQSERELQSQYQQQQRRFVELDNSIKAEQA